MLRLHFYCNVISADRLVRVDERVRAGNSEINEGWRRMRVSWACENTGACDSAKVKLKPKTRRYKDHYFELVTHVSLFDVISIFF